MNKLISFAVLCIFFLLSSISVAFAKGSADKITVSGPGLTNPIEIIDPQILQQFSPWGDSFFDLKKGLLAVSKPPKINRLYQINFYLKDADGTLTMRYAFQYAPGQPGYIYLPGINDKLYTLNSSLLPRYGFDGHWIYASQEWDGLMQRQLADHGVSVASSAAQPIYAKLFLPGVWLSLGAVLVLAGVSALVLRQRRHIPPR
jgi:hypothetical protein